MPAMVFDATPIYDGRAIIVRTKRSRNAWELVSYLRSGGQVGPELAQFLAEILAGVHPEITYREPPATQLVAAVQRNYRRFVERLRAGDVFLEERVWTLLGIRVSDDKRSIPRAARELVMLTYGISKSQFDSYAHPRAARGDRKRAIRKDAGVRGI